VALAKARAPMAQARGLDITFMVVSSAFNIVNGRPGRVASWKRSQQYMIVRRR
jgi:hypothetical protein